ncbi:MAG TPA: hypothetical protein VN026_10470 [Bacteroidia bacterium]|jgi:hypothetical protein|nr:hypothetical protein [Bacteroidia bacterium]
MRGEKEEIMETKSGTEGTSDLNPKTEEGILACSITPEIQDMDLLSDNHEKNAQFSGVFCKGVQYFDFKNIDFITNSDLANLIDLLKSLLKQGIALQFVNVNKKIKEKVKAMGLENILNCS